MNKIKIPLGSIWILVTLCGTISSISANTPSPNESVSPLIMESHINTDNYTVIQGYIRTKYKQISPETAHSISYEICKQTQEIQLDPLLFASIIAVESRFNPTAVGRGNASGLGQMMPGTYRHYQVQHPFDISENITGMIRYISELNDLWKSHDNAQTLILVSYNRGETFVKRHKNDLGEKAIAYVNKVMFHYKNLEDLKKTLVQSQSPRSE